MIANRITPACPYILPLARRRSGMVARQVRRSVVMSNLQIRLLPMDSDRTPLEKGKDVLHGAARAAPLRQSVEQPWVPDQLRPQEARYPVSSSQEAGPRCRAIDRLEQAHEWHRPDRMGMRT